MKLCGLLPKRRFDSEFIGGLNEDAQVSDQTFCAVMKVYCGISARRTDSDLKALAAQKKPLLKAF